MPESKTVNGNRYLHETQDIRTGSLIEHSQQDITILHTKYHEHNIILVGSTVFLGSIVFICELCINEQTQKIKDKRKSNEPF